MSDDDARERGQADFDRLLPEGLDTDRHDLFTAYDGDEPVGTLWLCTQQRARGDEVFVYQIAVDPAKRRRGYGRVIMQAAIARARESGKAAMGLIVFGHNDAARALYDSLGFRVASTSMQLDL